MSSGYSSPTRSKQTTEESDAYIMKFINNKLLPNNALCIPIRENLEVIILNIPHDFTKQEANKVEKVIMALTNQSPNNTGMITHQGDGRVTITGEPALWLGKNKSLEEK